MAIKGPKYGMFAEIDGGQLLDEMRFLARAVSHDETRAMMGGINIEVVSEATEETPYQTLLGVATDGRRIHIVEPLNKSAGPLFGLTAGLWAVISANLKRVQLAKINEPAGDYPNWRKIMPTAPVVSRATFEGFTLTSSRHASESSIHLYKLARALPECEPINLDYLSDLGYGDTWTVEWRRKGGSLLFRNQNVKTAIIMPMVDD